MEQALQATPQVLRDREWQAVLGGERSINLTLNTSTKPNIELTQALINIVEALRLRVKEAVWPLAYADGSVQEAFANFKNAVTAPDLVGNTSLLAPRVGLIISEVRGGSDALVAISVLGAFLEHANDGFLDISANGNHRLEFLSKFHAAVGNSFNTLSIDQSELFRPIESIFKTYESVLTLASNDSARATELIQLSLESVKNLNLEIQHSDTGVLAAFDRGGAPEALDRLITIANDSGAKLRWHYFSCLLHMGFEFFDKLNSLSSMLTEESKLSSGSLANHLAQRGESISFRPKLETILREIEMICRQTSLPNKGFSDTGSDGKLYCSYELK